jgi:hypothetical protein
VVRLEDDTGLYAGFTIKGRFRLGADRARLALERAGRKLPLSGDDALGPESKAKGDYVAFVCPQSNKASQEKSHCRMGRKAHAELELHWSCSESAFLGILRPAPYLVVPCFNPSGSSPPAIAATAMEWLPGHRNGVGAIQQKKGNRPLKSAM